MLYFSRDREETSRWEERKKTNRGQEKINRKINSPCRSEFGELKNVLFIPVEKDLHCAVLRAPSPKVFTRLSLSGAK